MYTDSVPYNRATGGPSIVICANDTKEGNIIRIYIILGLDTGRRARVSGMTYFHHVLMEFLPHMQPSTPHSG